LLSGNEDARREAVARVASTMFGTSMLPSDVNGETPKLATHRNLAAESVKAQLAPALTAVAPCLLQLGPTRLVRPWEDKLLANGRALLAVLLAGAFRIEGRGVTFRLSSLKEVERRRAFHFGWIGCCQAR